MEVELTLDRLASLPRRRPPELDTGLPGSKMRRTTIPAAAARPVSERSIALRMGLRSTANGRPNRTGRQSSTQSSRQWSVGTDVHQERNIFVPTLEVASTWIEREFNRYGLKSVHKLAGNRTTYLTSRRILLILMAASAQAGVPATQSYAVLLYVFICAIPFGRDWLVAGT